MWEGFLAFVAAVKWPITIMVVVGMAADVITKVYDARKKTPSDSNGGSKAG